MLKKVQQRSCTSSTGIKMASNSKPAKPKACDIVVALMEKLVDPALASIFSIAKSPSKEDQESVAKQMHAVALLYNYYHRKKNPDAEFVEFETFCKLAVEARPLLAWFMNLTKPSKIELNGREELLSLTEKAIKDACNTAIALDASLDEPNINDWPVSKVAVLLVDSEDNCMLLFGKITEGVWSPFEKEITPRRQTFEGKVGQKRARNSLKLWSYENELRLIAYDIVKDITGSQTSELKVLKSHVVYSLSKENTSTQFFVIQSPQTLDESNQHPLWVMVESLRGPLAENHYGSWTAGQVVEYYHMLPYNEVISNWLLGDDLPNSSRNNVEKDANRSQKEPTAVLGLDFTGENNIESNKSAVKFIPCAETGNTIIKKKNSCREEVVENCVKIILQSKERNNDANTNMDKRTPVEYDSSSSGSQKAIVPNPSKGSSKRTMVADDVIEKTNERCEIIMENEDTTNKQLSSDELQCHRKLERISSSQLEKHDDNSKVMLLDSLKASHTQFESHENLNQEIVTKNLQTTLQTAMDILYGGRQKLCSKIRSKEEEDMLELYEHSLERIREGGDVTFAKKCIDSFINGNIDWMLNEEYKILSLNTTQSKSSGIYYIPGKSKSKDLELICLHNRWRLPGYLAEPSDGTLFKWRVFIFVSNTLKLSATGLGSNPVEAREAAASEIIKELSNYQFD